MSDPFAQFGGKQIEADVDPFEEFGGKSETQEEDPFAQFGGEQQPSISHEEDPEYTKVRGILNRSFWAAPLVTSEETTDAEIAAVARKHGFDPEVAKSIAPMAGALGQGTTAEEVESSLARGPGFNVPQLITKKTIEDPKLRAMFDELQDLADAKRSFARGISENILPLGAVARLIEKAGTTAAKEAGKQVAKQTLKRAAAEGAAMGGVAGTARSHEGQEIESGLMGSALGTGFGVGAYGLGKLFARRGASVAEAEALDDMPEVREMDLTAETTRMAEKNREAEDQIARALLDGVPIEKPEEVIKLNYTPEDVQRLLSNDTDEGIALGKRTLDARQREALTQGFDRAKVSQLADDAVESRAKDFVEKGLDLDRPKTMQDALEAIETYKRQGPEYLRQKYDDYVNFLNAERALEETGIRASPESSLGRAANKISGVQQVLNVFDKKAGTRTEAALRKLSEGDNLMTYPRTTFRIRLNKILELAEKNEVNDAMRNGGVVDLIESGGIKSAPQPVQEVAKQVQRYFATGRNFANKGFARVTGKAGMAIPELENYVSRVAVEMPEIVARVEKRLEAALETASKMTRRPVRQLGSLSDLEFRRLIETSPETRELIEFINWKDSNKELPKRGADLSAALHDSLYGDAGFAKTEKLSRATMERTGNIPAFIREKNLYKIMDRYIYDVLSTLYRREGLDALRLEMRKLKRAGFTSEAKFVENIITDTYGTRKGTAAALMRNIKTEVARGLDDKIQAATSRTEKLALETAKELVHLPSFMGRHLYHNVLGFLNLRQPVQNLLSGISRTAPEMGNRYGLVTYIRGFTQLVANYRKAGESVAKYGFSPRGFVRDGERATADGIRSTRAFGKNVERIEAVAHMLGVLVRVSEDINRRATLNAAEFMAQDLAKPGRLGDMARNSLRRFPKPVQDDVAAAKSVQEVTKILGSYLTAKTTFHYTRANMFELGRDLGPMFSTFAKWPTEVGGEVISEIRMNRLGRGLGIAARRLLPVFGAFTGIDYALYNYAGMEDNPTYKRIMGSYGLKSVAPINALTGFVEGGIFTPVAVDTIMKGIITPAINGDGPSLTRGLDAAASQYVPGAGFIKLILQDIPLYITGEKPEGSTNVERSIEGAEILKRELSK